MTAIALLLPSPVLAAGATAPPAERSAEPDALPTVTDEPEPPPDDEIVSDANLERAMKAFDSGSENYSRAQYKDALDDFLVAASLYASPDFQYNIGLCYEKLDKPEEAIRAFEIYLKTKSEIPDRANVEDRIARLLAVIEQRERDGGKPAVTTTDAPKPAAFDAARERRRAVALLASGGALAGIGLGVALGGGLGFGLAAKRRSDDLEEIQSGGNPQGRSFADAEALEREGKRLEVGQITVVAVGAAVGLVGVALLAIGAQRLRKAKRAPKTALAPSFGGRGVGLSLLGRF